MSDITNLVPIELTDKEIDTFFDQYQEYQEWKSIFDYLDQNLALSISSRIERVTLDINYEYDDEGGTDAHIGDITIYDASDEEIEWLTEEAIDAFILDTGSQGGQAAYDHLLDIQRKYKDRDFEVPDLSDFTVTNEAVREWAEEYLYDRFRDNWGEINLRRHPEEEFYRAKPPARDIAVIYKLVSTNKDASDDNEQK